MAILLLILMIANAACSPPLGFTQEPAAQEPEGLEQVRELLKKRQYEEAEASSREIQAEVKRAHGPRSFQVALVLDIIVEAMWR